MSSRPDGEQLAVAVKSGPNEAIALVDVATGAIRHHYLPDIDQVYSVAWNPRGRLIAFSGSKGGYSNIYLLDIVSGETSNVNEYAYFIHAPDYSPECTLICV